MFGSVHLSYVHWSNYSSKSLSFFQSFTPNNYSCKSVLLQEVLSIFSLVKNRWLIFASPFIDSGVHLHHPCPWWLRLFSSSMLGWMYCILKSGNLLRTGQRRVLFTSKLYRSPDIFCYWPKTMNCTCCMISFAIDPRQWTGDIVDSCYCCAPKH